MPKLQERRRAHINNFMYKRLDKAALRDNRDIRTRAHDAPLFKVLFLNVKPTNALLPLQDHANGIAYRRTLIILIIMMYSRPDRKLICTCNAVSKGFCNCVNVQRLIIIHC